MMPGPIQFVQVHFFYPAYLNTFFAENPGLKNVSYAAMVGAMFQDGYSGTHLIGPDLEAFGYKSALIVANCEQTQRRWFLEREEQATALSAMERLARQLDSLNPDVVYFTDPVHFHDELIQTLRRKPRVILGWRAAHVPKGIRWESYDVMLSCLTRMRSLALEKGAAAAEPFAPGFPERVLTALGPVAKDVDITFVGHYVKGIHPERNSLLEVVASVAARLGATCHMHLSGELEAVPEVIRPFMKPPVFGMAMYRALARSRITFDARGRIWLRDAHAQKVEDIARNETANMRIFEATGCGSLLLTERRDNLARFFEPDTEVAVFRDAGELEEKLVRHLENRRESEEMAARAQRRCLGEHSMRQRARQLDAIIRAHL